MELPEGVTHIYDWLDSNEKSDNELTKRMWEFFDFKTKSATFQYKNKLNVKLYCQFEGQKYRITGASRLGDIYLASDMEREIGYDTRVFIDDCDKFEYEELKEAS